MDVKSYCSNMRNEVESWKTQIDGHMKKADRRSADMNEAPKAIFKINELVTEMEEAINRLEVECPADWSAEKARVGRHPERSGAFVAGGCRRITGRSVISEREGASPIKKNLMKRPFSGFGPATLDGRSLL